MQTGKWGLPGRFLLMDHDGKFTREFDAVFESEGTEVKRVGPVAPNLNAYAERWVQSLRQECLDHLVVLGENHLRHVSREYVEHSNAEWPHQARGNVPLPDAGADGPRGLPFPGGEARGRGRVGRPR